MTRDPPDLATRTRSPLRGRIDASPGCGQAVAVAGGKRSETLSYDVRRAMGRLLPLLDDPRVRDVLVQVSEGTGRLWLDRGGPLELIDGWRATPEAVRRFAVALIAAGGRQLDELHPLADVHLGRGIRAHAALPPVAASGAAVSIRVPSFDALGFARLVAEGLCDEATARFLRSAVLARRNLLITGGTATGKTTLLAGLLALAPEGERIVTIEDLAELRIDHPHRIALESRRPNAEGIGEISLDRLLREALRMRPDRLVLGECRGAELVTMLAALNTGHDGGAATMHASRLDGVPTRLEALGGLAGLSPAGLARQAVTALHLVVHLERGTDGRRRIVGLGRLRLVDGVLGVERLRPGHAEEGARSHETTMRARRIR